VEISLDDYKGVWLVLLFYPFDFTYVCPTELLAFSDAHKSGKFDGIKTEILGISTDSHHTHRAWLNTPRARGGLGSKIQFPLIGDVGKSISKMYDVLVEDDSDPMAGAALRGLYIIDDK